MAFSKAKASRLKCTDFSRKGEIDRDIVPLVEMINKHDSYFTTSSCSGRIIVFCENQDESGVKKKGCQWLFVSHDLATTEKTMQALEESEGNAVLKFEPFVLHVQCETVDHARRMHQAAVASGFRNSGITIGNGGKIMTAVRSTHGLEVPITKEGRLLVSEEYLDFIIDLANSKMKENLSRIEKFHKALQSLSVEQENDEHISNTKKAKDGMRLMKRHSVKHKLTQTEIQGTPPDRMNTDNECYSQNNLLARVDESVERYMGDSHDENDQESQDDVEQTTDVSSDLQGFASIFSLQDEKT